MKFANLGSSDRALERAVQEDTPDYHKVVSIAALMDNSNYCLYISSENYGSSSNIPLLMYSNSDAKLDITVSDSDESFDYSFDDSNSELSLSYHSSDSPSPLKHDGANRPFSKGLNSKTDIPYDSTQSFTMSSDEEDNLEESDFKHNDFDLYDSNNSSGNDDDDDDGNMGSGWSPQSTTRLLSLTASDITECRENEYEEDEELSNNAEVPNFKVSSKKQQKDSGRQIKNQNSTNPPPLEPVGLFWDIENCQVPIDKSAFALANKMRQIFFQGKREAEFMCVCDITKERKEVADDLHRAHVSYYNYMYIYMYVYFACMYICMYVYFVYMYMYVYFVYMYMYVYFVYMYMHVYFAWHVHGHKCLCIDTCIIYVRVHLCNIRVHCMFMYMFMYIIIVKHYCASCIHVHYMKHC